jgi:tetratricopeptide (TPR) repeat protein
VLHELAKSLYAQKKGDEAERRLKECLQVTRDSVGLEHPRAAIAVMSAADLLASRGKAAEALALFDEALAANARRFGPVNRWRFGLAVEAATLEAQHGKPERAEERARDALAQLPKSVMQENRRASLLNNLALELARRDRRAAAEECYRAALAIRRDQAAPPRDQMAVELSNYGDLLLELGRPSESAAMQREAIAVGKGTTALRDESAVIINSQLGKAEMRLGRFAEAEKAFRESVALARTLPAYPAVRRSDRLTELAAALAEQGRLAEAVPVLRDAASVTVKGQTTYFEGQLRYLATAHALLGERPQAEEVGRTLTRHFTGDKRIPLRLRVLRTLLLLDLPGEGTAESKAEFAARQLVKSPEDREAAAVSALALLRLGKPAEAERVLRALPADAAAKSPLLGFLLAWAVLDRGDHDAARESVRKASGLLDAAATADAAATGEWHERLEARVLRQQLEKRLEP